MTAKTIFGTNMPTIKVNDIDLYYETFGQGEPLVFIAGLTSDLRLWSGIVEAYAQKYQVIVFDNRGSGKSSDKPDYPYTAQVMADDTIGLIKALDFQRVHVVGHSMGGCVAQTLAVKYPDFVKSIVLANTLLKVQPHAQLFGEIRLEMMQANTPVSTITRFVAMACFSNEYLSNSNRIEQMVKLGLPAMTLPGYEHQLAGLLAFDSKNWVANIKKPCLVIGADEDLIANVADSQYLAQAITDAEYFCFKKVGHVSLLEQPEIFNKVVLQFLGKH
jgi:3-oxoadipate enol-lactonase